MCGLKACKYCRMFVYMFGKTDVFFLFCCCSHFDLTLYNKGLKVCRITNGSLVTQMWHSVYFVIHGIVENFFM